MRNSSYYGEIEIHYVVCKEDLDGFKILSAFCSKKKAVAVKKELEKRNEDKYRRYYVKLLEEVQRKR